MSSVIEHDALVALQGVFLGSRQHLLEAIEVLDACEPRIAPQSGRTDAYRDTADSRIGRVSPPRVARDDASRQCAPVRRIAPAARAARNHQLQHGAPDAAANARTFLLERRGRWCRDGEPRAPERKTGQVPVQAQRPTILDRNGFEYSVTEV